MAHFDIHEQEQLSKIKYFWNDWGKYVIAVLVIAFVAYVSNVIWVSRASGKASEAAEIYRQLSTAFQNKDSNSVYKYADKLENSYSSTEYTSMGSLMAAKVAYNEKNFDKSSNYLNWVIKNSDDKGLIALATLRLADIYIDQKKFDQALSLLMQKHEASFDVLFYSKRGDLYVVKGDLTKARDAYKEAIAKAGQDQGTANMIQMKLDVLGN